MTSALLIMDVQQDVAESVGPGLLDRVAEALVAAREAGLPVIFIRVAFRPGFPEISPANRTFRTLVGAAGDRFAENGPATQIHPAVAPRPGEPIVVKKRVSAFTGSDLEVLLRSMNADHLVLTGIATSGVVLSTLREAADRDEEVHRVLLEKVFPRQATVTDVATWVEAL